MNDKFIYIAEQELINGSTQRISATTLNGLLNYMEENQWGSRDYFQGSWMERVENEYIYWNEALQLSISKTKFIGG